MVQQMLKLIALLLKVKFKSITEEHIPTFQNVPGRLSSQTHDVHAYLL